MGVSMGVRGAGVSLGPRGAYVHVGAGGFRYSQRIDSPKPKGQSPATPSSPSAPPREFIDSTSDALLDEIRRKARTIPLKPLAISIAVIGWIAYGCLLNAPDAELPRAIAIAAGILGLGSLPWVSWLDRRTRTAFVHYELDPLGTRVQDALDRLFADLAGARAVWAVQNEQLQGGLKSGGLTAVGRRPIRLGSGAPPFLKTNARVGVLKVDDARLYFFPDRVLMYRGGDVWGLRYGDLKVESGVIDILEDGGVPRDAHVIGKTWRFARKDGGPDHRFKGNHQIPIVRYGTLNLWADAGLQARLHLSAEGLAARTAQNLRDVQEAVHQIESRRSGPAPLITPPLVDEDPPPLLIPLREAVRGLIAVLSCRWLTDLPDWSAPAVWGVVAALTPVGIIVRYAQGGVLADLFLGAAVVMTVLASGRLLHHVLRRRNAERAQQSALAQARFRALLALEIKRKPLEDLRFSELLEASNAPRRDADFVADEILSQLAERFVRDGVITPEERSILGKLTQALEIDPTRAERILTRAKTAGSHKAVSKVLAEGITTDDETRMLERLRSQLGVAEPTQPDFSA